MGGERRKKRGAHQSPAWASYSILAKKPPARSWLMSLSDSSEVKKGCVIYVLKSASSLDLYLPRSGARPRACSVTRQCGMAARRASVC